MSQAIAIDNSWEIIESFENPSNDQLIKALSNGTNALKIIFTEPLEEGNVKELFEGIHINFINLYFEGDRDTIAIAQKVTNTAAKQQLFTFENQNFEDEIQHFLATSKDYIENTSELLNPFVIFKVSNKYLENISEIRSLRILWEHLLSSFNLKTPALKIICNVDQYDEDRSIEEDYIFGSIQLMSSIIASADAIEIKVPRKSDKDSSFKARIARNLHHLASLEGKMDMVKDPLKGSYFIEERSNALARAAWNKFTI